jgi:hypothetical protein
MKEVSDMFQPVLFKFEDQNNKVDPSVDLRANDKLNDSSQISIVDDDQRARLTTRTDGYGRDFRLMISEEKINEDRLNVSNDVSTTENEITL